MYKNKEVRVALCRFRGSNRKLYAYKTIEQDLKKDDLIIVHVYNTYEIALFVAYTNDNIYKELAKKWIIDKIDTEKHRKLKESEYIRQYEQAGLF